MTEAPRTQTASVPATDSTETARRPGFFMSGTAQRLLAFASLIIMLIGFSLASPFFMQTSNMIAILQAASVNGVLAIAVTLVIITGGIDLSIGSLIALSGVLLVQVVDLRLQATDYQSQVAELRTEVAQPLGGPVLRLVDGLPDIAAGDRLSYVSTSGRSSVAVRRLVEVDGQRWIELRDRPGLLRPGITVRWDRMTHNQPLLACGVVLLIAAGLGLVHGVLITWGRMQPFVVTLCGLLIYRGVARVLTGDNQIGLMGALPEFKSFFTGALFSVPLPLVSRISGQSDSWADVAWIELPISGLILMVVAIGCWGFLNRTVWGRHLLATGENERAARYSGINTSALVVAAYVASATLAGLTGILFTLELNSVQPASSGQFYELYAIAAAVLGGCSLRGGRGAVVAVIAGAAVMRCLYKAIVVLGISQQWEMVIIGAALLAAVALDEVVARWPRDAGPAGR